MAELQIKPERNFKLDNTNYKSGFVTVIGRPNVGKSTLINYLIGEKITIVSPKPQTTRNRITAILSLDEGQIIFLDTPGLHNGKKELNKIMMEQALSAIGNNDLVVFLTDTVGNVFEKDSKYFSLLKDYNVVLIINKVDLIQKEKLLPIMEKYSNTRLFKEIIPVSLKKGYNCEKLIKIFLKYLPEGPKYYPDDIISAENERFIVAEIIREKLFLETRKEVPYSVGILMDYFKEDENLIKIGATVVVERDSQKAIVIGKKGEMLKKIGSSARQDIEKLLGKKVFLTLFVKVIKNWTKDNKKIKEIFQG